MTEKSRDQVSSMKMSSNSSLSGVSRTNTLNLSEGKSVSVDSGEMAGLVATSLPKIEEKDKALVEKVCWRYKNASEELDNDDRHRLSSIRLWKNFVRTTTGHGFARMVDPSEPWHLRIFWTLIVIFLAGGLMTSITIISYESLVQRGLQREFIIQYNNSMYLPDIHICDTSLFSLSALECKHHHFTFNSGYNLS